MAGLLSRPPMKTVPAMVLSDVRRMRSFVTPALSQTWSWPGQFTLRPRSHADRGDLATKNLQGEMVRVWPQKYHGLSGKQEFAAIATFASDGMSAPATVEKLKAICTCANPATPPQLVLWVGVMSAVGTTMPQPLATCWT